MCPQKIRCCRSFAGERGSGRAVGKRGDPANRRPNGAIVYYWLDEGVSGPVSLVFHDDEGGSAVANFRSDDTGLPAAKRLSVRPGLTRFVWDLKYPGPEPLDTTLAPPRNKPLAEPADPTAGPTVVPGRYRVEMSLGSETMAAELSVVGDPRLATTPEDYRQQFELVRQLTTSLGKLNATVNRIRRLKRRLSVPAGGLEDGEIGAILAEGEFAYRRPLAFSYSSEVRWPTAPFWQRRRSKF
jgi:hypothetical protein